MSTRSGVFLGVLFSLSIACCAHAQRSEQVLFSISSPLTSEGMGFGFSGAFRYLITETFLLSAGLEATAIQVFETSPDPAEQSTERYKKNLGVPLGVIFRPRGTVAFKDISPYLGLLAIPGYSFADSWIDFFGSKSSDLLSLGIQAPFGLESWYSDSVGVFVEIPVSGYLLLAEQEKERKKYYGVQFRAGVIF
jgi:hypothetical protein